jgi:hypothetical protein
VGLTLYSVLVDLPLGRTNVSQLLLLIWLVAVPGLVVPVGEPLDVDWLDETTVSLVTMCSVVVFDPVVSVSLAKTRDLPSEGPLFCNRVLKWDSLAQFEFR